jgi:glutaredoxin-related protein
MNDRPQVAPAAQEKVQSFHADVVREVKDAVTQNDVVVVGMSGNPHVKRARKALTEAGIPFTYLEYGSYFSQWRQRLAIKLWSGWPTFPQVFVKGTLIGGADLTKTAIEEGKIPRG